MCATPGYSAITLMIFNSETIVILFQGFAWYLLALGIYKYTLTVRIPETETTLLHGAYSCIMCSVGMCIETLIALWENSPYTLNLGGIALLFVAGGFVQMYKRIIQDKKRRKRRK